jgi:hypothetical protein
MATRKSPNCHDGSRRLAPQRRPARTGTVPCGAHHRPDTVIAVSQYGALVQPDGRGKLMWRKILRFIPNPKEGRPRAGPTTLVC